MIKNNKQFFSFLKEHFPENKQRWFLYLKYSLPIIISGILFSLNGFIDNFMVTSIAHGVDALSYANAWTGIISGFIGGISIVCSVLIGQYWGAKEYQKVKQVMRLRVLMTLICMSIFAFFALFFTKEMISVFYQGKQDQDILQKSMDYLRLIVITWVIFSWTSPMSGLLAETGHGKESLISSIGSLIMNISLNFILIYVLDLGVKGAAYASIAARIFGIFGDTIFVYLKIKIAIIAPWSIFMISSEVWKKFLVRIHSALLFASVTVLIVLRNTLFNRIYPQGSIGKIEWAIGSAAILGLAGAISEIFLSVFSALGSNVSFFVGTYLGKKDFNQAKKNANELKGFHAVISFGFSLLLIILAFSMPHFSFFASQVGKESNSAAAAQVFYLNKIKYVLLLVAFLNPIWVWFSTSARLIASGGKTNLVSILDSSLELTALIWLIIITFAIKPNELKWDFNFTYFIFFLVDLIKFLVYEVVYLKTNWAKHIDESSKVVVS